MLILLPSIQPVGRYVSWSQFSSSVVIFNLIFVIILVQFSDYLFSQPVGRSWAVYHLLSVFVSGGSGGSCHTVSVWPAGGVTDPTSLRGAPPLIPSSHEGVEGLDIQPAGRYWVENHCEDHYCDGVTDYRFGR